MIKTMSRITIYILHGGCQQIVYTCKFIEGGMRKVDANHLLESVKCYLLRCGYVEMYHTKHHLKLHLPFLSLSLVYK